MILIYVADASALLTELCRISIVLHLHAALWGVELKYLDFSVSLAWILAIEVFILLIWPFCWLLLLLLYPKCRCLSQGRTSH